MPAEDLRASSLDDVEELANSEVSSTENGDGRTFLEALGDCVRVLRKRQQYSRRELSERSGVSPRFIAQLESGAGNISIMRLKSIADALDTPLATIVALNPDGRQGVGRTGGKFALVGLRGAGKSTLGRLVSDRLQLPFIELNAEISKRCGMGLTEIFALYGDQRYRELERETLDSVIDMPGPLVLAIAGGIVEEPATYQKLLDHFTTIWVRTSPDEHMARVLAQGDRRPVAGHPAAMDHLVSLLHDREPAYARAHADVDTSGKQLDQSVAELQLLIENRLA